MRCTPLFFSSNDVFFCVEYQYHAYYGRYGWLVIIRIDGHNEVRDMFDSYTTACNYVCDWLV